MTVKVTIKGGNNILPARRMRSFFLTTRLRFLQNQKSDKRCSKARCWPSTSA